MSADKYPSIFWRQMEAIVYLSTGYDYPLFSVLDLQSGAGPRF